MSIQHWCVQGYKVPEGLRATNSMAEAVERSEIILMVVPTQFVARTMTDMAKLLQPHQVGGMLRALLQPAGHLLPHAITPLLTCVCKLCWVTGRADCDICAAMWCQLPGTCDLIS